MLLVTFRFFLGSMTAMFQPGKAPSVLREVECALSIRTITEIILPALSMAVTEPISAARKHTGAHDQLKAKWEKLSASQSDLLFYCDLISWFVKAQDRHEPLTFDVGYHGSARGSAMNIPDTQKLDIDAI